MNPLLKIKIFLIPLEKFLILQFPFLVFNYLIKTSKSSIYPRLKDVFIPLLELVVNKLKIVREDNSFANEFKIVENFLDRICRQSGYLVDIGASNGVNQSSTLKLLINHNYSGALFEFDSKNFAMLAFVYNSRNDICLTKTKITPENIVHLMNGLNIPKTFDFLNIDIDSYDLSILRSLLAGGFKPNLISMEINEIFPPHLEFEVLFDANQNWIGDHFFGCSIASADKVLNNFGYKLAHIEYNNAFFYNKDLQIEFDSTRTIDEMYNQGYRDKTDRKSKFPNNQDVDCLLDLSGDAGEQIILDLFQKYDGKYTLTKTV
jgi:hypothetical protein